MLYGHIESAEDRVDHLLRLRKLQDETGGFMAFIPLSFHPEGTRIQVRQASGMEDLRTIAVSRLVLDNVDHIKAYWTQTGLKVAQLALHFGADDIDGTVVEETITHMAGGKAPRGVGEKALRDLIRSAGRVPVRRDTLHRDMEQAA
jgi:aminodeoxyfutalosine synthase